MEVFQASCAKRAPITVLASLVAVFTLLLWLPLMCLPMFAQEAARTTTSTAAAAPRPLITQAIDESQLSTLKGNTHPLARPQFDLGTADASLPMARMLLVLKRSAAQETALDQFLDDQQNKGSANYHQWLTPEQYGQQFGPTDSDLQTITAWLQSHGFQVGTTKGRTVLEFSGTAGQVQEAFHTTIHKYLVNGEQHWANASDPQIPTALTPAVAGVASLNNFQRRAMNVPAGVAKREKGKEISTTRSANPLFTYQPYYQCSADNYCFDIAPYDFATIYNLLPLWGAGTDGTGVTIAISGETDIEMSDVEAFRSMFGLPANDPVFVLNGPDPGIQGDESEADIDVQWSGAVAKGATIDFVISASTETTSGVDLSAVYIVDQNLAPIMSESYGECELGLGTTGNQFYNALWQQAAAEGITVFISAGDGGSAGCDNFDAQPPAPAQFGLQVSGYASTPYNVAVGGTDFNEFTNPTLYWNTTNDPTTQASALGYIPEITWDSSCTSQAFGPPNFSSSAVTNCNNSELAGTVDVVGGSGGASDCTTPSGNTPGTCAGGYPRPSWQTGNGSFSNDGKRDIPDVSLFASSGWAGTAYVICQADYPQGGPCPSYNPRFGGTSVSSPALAGVMALINQKYGRQGNANYVFYKLAQKSGASCTSSTSEATSCIFNDVTVGTNEGACTPGTPDCLSNGEAYGVMSGYSAGSGYDLATGLGSVNANNLVNAWSTVTTLPSTTTLSNVSPIAVTHGQPVSFTVAVKPQTGSGTPTGIVSLAGPATGTSKPGIGAFSLSGGSVTASTDLLPGGSYSLTAHYPGDATYSASDSGPISVTVNKENSQPQAFLVTFNSSNNVVSYNTNTAQYGSPYILRVNVDNAAGQLCAPVATSGATACPTGTVAMTNNGSTLDAGTFTLNSYGYFEDLTVQLPGGTNSVKSAYAGDNSFNASSATNAISITPAATGTGAPSIGGVGPWVGTALYANTTVTAQSSGNPPGGNVTFLVNGVAAVGTVTYSGTAGSASNPSASLSAAFLSSVSPFTTPGSYSISASYSGDANYGASTSGVTNLAVQFYQPTVALSPFTQNVLPGNTATVTAVVDTTDKTIYPTGSVTFVNESTNQNLGPAVNCVNGKDSSGNYECIATFTFVPSGGTTVVQAQYSGDVNYPGAASGAVVVNVPDFAINPNTNPVTVTQGQAQTASIIIGGLGGFTGNVSNFACSGLPAETTCSFSPATVTGGNGSTTLTITTTAIGQMRRRAANENRRRGWMAAAVLPLLGICLIGIPAWRRRGVLAALVTIAFFVMMLPSCGGGGGGTTPPPNNPVPSITSIAPTQQAAGSQSQTLTITGTGFVSGTTATYNNVAHPVSYSGSTVLTITLTAADMAATGSYPVVVTNPTPGGGASGAVDFNVVTGTPVGSFNVTVTASSGSLTHTTNFNLVVQ